MHIDRVTKVLLGVLVLVLAVLAFRPFLASEAAPPPRVARSYDHVKFLGAFGSGIGANILLLDATNGNIWSYNLIDQRATYVGQLTELGQPLTAAQQ
jgi:hypothetical protein